MTPKKLIVALSLLLLSTSIPMAAEKIHDRDMLNDQSLLSQNTGSDYRFTPNATMRGEHVTLKTVIRPVRSSAADNSLRGTSYIQTEAAEHRQHAISDGAIASGSTIGSMRATKSEQTQMPIATTTLPISFVAQSVADKTPFQNREDNMPAVDSQQPPIAYVGDNPPEPPASLYGSGLGVLLLLTAAYGLKKR